MSSTSPNVVIRASAGTGKTYQLTNEYLRLVLRGVAPEAILACTFTRKAAGEILERVLVRLADAVYDEKDRQQLAHAVGFPLSAAQVQQALVAVTSNLHRVRITTLDAFFAALARAFCMELGLPLQWDIVDEVSDQRLRQEALAEVLAHSDPHAVARLVVLIHQGASPRSVAVSLQQVINEVYAIYRESQETAWAMPTVPGRLSTDELHTILNQLAQWKFSDKRFDKARQSDIEYARAGAWDKLLTGGLAKAVLKESKTYFNKEIPAAVEKLYQKLIRHAQSVLLDEWNAQTRATRELLHQFHDYYTRRKLEMHRILFEDVTYALAEGLKPELVQQAVFRLDGHIERVLIDEFQDTSAAQWRVIEPIVKAALEQQPRGSFWCVGDVKQAIYGWRGGCAEIFGEVESHVGNLQREYLTKSYRSSPVVIQTVNQVFEGLRAITPTEWEELKIDPVMVSGIQSWVAGYEPHTTAREGLPGCVIMEVAQDEEEEQDQADGGSEAVGGAPTHIPQTMQLAAEKVAEWHRQAPTYTIGVLTRTNRGVAQMIFLLRRRGITASEEGGNPVTDSAPVTNVLSLLLLADNPGDTIARFHVASSPLGELLGYEDWRDDEATLAVAAQVRQALVLLGYGAYLSQLMQPLLPHVSDREHSRLKQLVEFAYCYQPQATLRPRDFVRWVSVQRAADPQTVGVRVMSIHQAKGLEFDIVVLPELNFRDEVQRPKIVAQRPRPTQPYNRVCMYRRRELQELLPAEYQEMFRDELRRQTKDTLCLLYVAMTRAVHALHIVAPAKCRSLALKLLRHTLCKEVPWTPGSTVFVRGDRHWYQQHAKPVSPAVALETRQVPRIQFARASHTVIPTSPSRLERGGITKVADLLSVHRMVDMAQGRALHALLERVVWWEDFRWDDEEFRRIVAQSLQNAPATVDVDSVLQDFRAALHRRAIRDALSKTRYEQSVPWWQHPSTKTGQTDLITWEVYTERRLIAKQDTYFLTGAIDRLVIGRCGTSVVAAEILDYKSDYVSSADPHALQQLIEDYRPQLQAYREAVCQLYGLPTNAVRTTLIFLFSPIDPVQSC